MNIPGMFATVILYLIMSVTLFVQWLCNQKKTFYCLLLITLIGAALRLLWLAKESIWLDEAYTVMISISSFSNILANYSLDVHPPLFYLLEHVVIVLQGSISEFAIRLFPAICGILSIPVVYLIGKEASDENTGLLMAAMLAVSQFAIHYSREARMYSLVLLFCSVAFLYWIRYVKDPQTKNLVVFSIFSALALWTHFYTVVFVWILVLFLPRWLDRLEALVITGVICLPLVGPVMTMAQHQLSLTITGLVGIDVVNGVAWYLTGFNPFGFLLLGTLFFIGLWVMWERDRRLALVCAALVFGSIAFGVVTSYVGLHQEARYYIFLLPVFFLVIAEVPRVLERITIYKSDFFKGVTQVKSMWYLGLITIILLSMIVALPAYYTTDQRDSWREAELITRDAPRIVIPAFNQIPLTYYSHKEEHGYTYFSEIPANFTRGYVIVGPAGGYDPAMQGWYSNLTVYKNVTGITVYWWER